MLFCAYVNYPISFESHVDTSLASRKSLQNLIYLSKNACQRNLKKQLSLLNHTLVVLKKGLYLFYICAKKEELYCLVSHVTIIVWKKQQYGVIF